MHVPKPAILTNYKMATYKTYAVVGSYYLSLGLSIDNSVNVSVASLTSPS